MRTRRRKKINGILSLFIFFICAFLLTIFVMYKIEMKVVPSLQEISHNRSMAMANEIINDSIQKVMAEQMPSSDTFLIMNDKENATYSVNTQQINLFCTNLNKKINTAMQALPNERILIPLGAASKTNFFANWGPLIPFTLMPSGEITSDYETSFVTAGINQINYKIWINVTLEIQIVNPLYSEKISLTKKIMLVDTIIGGKVPGLYFSAGQN
ncbi:sporulation protein YunB [Anaerotignum neopropionicum]|uniref:Sporulation protein YunB n=1 Tax=Anaerotignum neopropionicum TaxID=36847 RepID=A0A136WFH7_9FIRM|nr:sporulation protein YunB [Anaerotignum neopropionicum]KXL53254.1 sporulation protein YunB [Anaerotignum neopropionicum]